MLEEKSNCVQKSFQEGVIVKGVIVKVEELARFKHGTYCTYVLSPSSSPLHFSLTLPCNVSITINEHRMQAAPKWQDFLDYYLVYFLI